MEISQKKRSSPASCPLKISGAGGRNRTDMELPPRDFESRASTSFTTPAFFCLQKLLRLLQIPDGIPFEEGILFVRIRTKLAPYKHFLHRALNSLKVSAIIQIPPLSANKFFSFFSVLFRNSFYLYCHGLFDKIRSGQETRIPIFVHLNTKVPRRRIPAHFHLLSQTKLLRELPCEFPSLPVN